MRKTVRIMVLVMVAVVIVSACGAVRKVRDKERFERSVALEERTVVSEGLRFDSRWLSGQWDMSSGWMLVLIESDSVIAFDPSDGFEVQGGRVLYQQSGREASASVSAGRESLETQTDSLSESTVQTDESMSSTVVDKEREATSGWTWSWVLLGGAIGIGLLVLRKLKWN